MKRKEGSWGLWLQLVILVGQRAGVLPPRDVLPWILGAWREIWAAVTSLHFHTFHLHSEESIRVSVPCGGWQWCHSNPYTFWSLSLTLTMKLCEGLKGVIRGYRESNCKEFNGQRQKSELDKKFQPHEELLLVTGGQGWQGTLPFWQRRILSIQLLMVNAVPKFCLRSGSWRS